jgi:hypothetical protein
MVDFNQRMRERRIAAEIAHAIQALGPTLPENLDRDVVCGIFADFFDKHGIVDESAGARILAHTPKVLAKLNFKFAELNAQLDAAVRQHEMMRTKL